MKMSSAVQWDAVNGEVLRYQTIQASMDHDHQLERYYRPISDVTPVEFLVERLTEPSIVFTCRADDVQGIIQDSL